MILEYVRYRISAPQRRSEFERAYTSAAHWLDASPYCLGYDLSHGVEEPERFVLRIEWTSREDHEKGFRGGPHFPPFLEAVRPFIGDIEEMKHYEPTPVRGSAGSPGEGTLFEAVGGMDVLRRLAESFYALVLEDPLLAPVFAGFTPDHREHVTVWLSEVFGGPADFTARLGGHQALLQSHLGLAITEEQRARWMELMDEAVRRELPPDARLRRTVLEYFDWGTRIARDVSQAPPGTDLGDPGPTPRWGWDGEQG